MKYFTNIKTVEELKKAYFALAKKYHPDMGGSVEIMKEINNEYETLFEKVKDIHTSVKEDSAEETYTAKAPTNEAPEDFINIIKFLLSLGGLDIELCGRWLWIGGNTKEHKEELKAMGCKWSSSKKLWSWHYDGDATPYHKKHSQDMSHIRSKYGSVSFESSGDQLLLA